MLKKAAFVSKPLTSIYQKLCIFGLLQRVRGVYFKTSQNNFPTTSVWEILQFRSNDARHIPVRMPVFLDFSANFQRRGLREPFQRSFQNSKTATRDISIWNVCKEVSVGNHFFHFLRRKMQPTNVCFINIMKRIHLYPSHPSSIT